MRTRADGGQSGFLRPGAGGVRGVRLVTVGREGSLKLLAWERVSG